MRLIDADYFKEQIAAAALKENVEPKKGIALMELVDVQPTAYDMDRVAEQLREYMKESSNPDYNRAMAEAIETVKAGFNE